MLGIVSAPEHARAQADVNPPLPNVMLLVDTSGSMEYKIGSDQFPVCSPAGGQSSTEKSRWIELLEVLTGTISDYRCQRIDRTAQSFATGEYGSGGPLNRTPYDYLYQNPYHRPLSGTCAPAPGALDPTNAYAWPAGAITFHEYLSPTSSCTFRQSTDGILDSFERAVRFGLMTFDPLPHPGTGVSGKSPDLGNGILGTWSYVWGAPRAGRPAGCLTDQVFEVGARNAAAPPWEGRMVAFGDPSPGSLEFLTKKSQIEQILLATRPYGATPIAGMLEDAADFFLNDTSADPFNPSNDFGPRSDPYVAGGCRDQFIILLSDGQPNMDLRAQPGEDPGVFCTDSPRTCPFRKPEQIAFDLASQTPPIYTFVVGFALPEFEVAGTQRTCNDLADSDFTDGSGLCNDPAHFGNTALQACCALNRIAIAGGTATRRRAFFAANAEELSSALSQILTEITPVTSRTQPVVSGAAGGASGFRFYSSVRPVSFQPWVGVLERQRYTCESETAADGSTRYFAKAQPIDRNKGDDFAANVNSGLGRPRWFVSVEGGVGGEPVHSRRSIRPYLPEAGGSDGVGEYRGEQYAGEAAAFVANTQPEAMELTGVCTDVNDTGCRDRYLRWLVGLDNGTSFTRCKALNTSECYLLGDILHSTPRVVGPPSEFVRDETYETFRRSKGRRPVVLYTSTNDGFLHAFKVAGTPEDLEGSDSAAQVMTKANNELWAFVPPAILPDIRSQYPFTHQVLLDGVPVVRDVVATISGEGPSARIQLERTRSQAATAEGTYRTILVQGFGPARGGYFALDVTDPDPQEDYPSSTPHGPRFLWQLTTDESGTVPLFGRGGATPLITTLYFDPGDGSGAREIAVAVLPGGRGEVDGVGTQCPNPARTFTGIDSRFPPRGRVRCYNPADAGAHSVTIVRLDSGEIVRTFRRSADEIELPDSNAEAALRQRVIEAPLDSPITGQPVAFPAETGAVADRVYVGDQDGRIFRINLGSEDPDDWSMDLFFDAYPATYAGDPNFPNDADDGQPILLPPVVSVTATGDVTLNVATGDQDTLGASPGMKNFVWSLTEKANADRTQVTTQVNWFLPLTGGERVVGPMVLFNSALYFASYTPPSSGASVCSNGSGRVFGMHYTLPVPGMTSTRPLNQGGEARLPGPDNTLVQSRTSADITGDSNSIVFGVTVAQQPTCSARTQESPRDFLGYGIHRQITSVTPGKFELVMHTGSGGSKVEGGSSNVRTLELRPPANAARVEGWAALVE